MLSFCLMFLGWLPFPLSVIAGLVVTVFVLSLLLRLIFAFLDLLPFVKFFK